MARKAHSNKNTNINYACMWAEGSLHVACMDVAIGTGYPVHAFTCTTRSELCQTQFMCLYISLHYRQCTCIKSTCILLAVAFETFNTCTST